MLSQQSTSSSRLIHKAITTGLVYGNGVGQHHRLLNPKQVKILKIFSIPKSLILCLITVMMPKPEIIVSLLVDQMYFNRRMGAKMQSEL